MRVLSVAAAAAGAKIHGLDMLAVVADETPMRYCDRISMARIGESSCCRKFEIPKKVPEEKKYLSLSSAAKSNAGFPLVPSDPRELCI